MTDISIFFMASATEKSGGLFDLDGTLPLIAIQFLALMFFLNFILYTPLLTVINDRNSYISKNLKTAISLLSQSNQLLKQYENELLKARKEAQLEILTLKKLHKSILETEVKSSQKIIEGFIKMISASLKVKKYEVFFTLENEIDSLSKKIILKILA